MHTTLITLCLSVVKIPWKFPVLFKTGFEKESAFYQDKYYNNFEAGKGAKKKHLPLMFILKVGTKIIFYEEHIDELKYLL